jgi:hypothetical protein
MQLLRLLGVVPLPRRVCVSGGRVEGGAHLGLLQVTASDAQSHTGEVNVRFNVTFKSDNAAHSLDASFAVHGYAEGLWALGAAEAQRALSAIACVVGLLVQWASQGQHWAHMARDLLQVRGPITFIIVCACVCLCPRLGPRMPDSTRH